MNIRKKINKDKLKKKILYYVKKCGEVTFLSLQNYLIENDFDIIGDFLFEIEDYNIVCWDGMSSDFIDCIVDLLEGKFISLEICSMIEYDTCNVSYPVAEDFPENKLDKIHFLPMMLTENVDILDLF